MGTGPVVKSRALADGPSVSGRVGWRRNARAWALLAILAGAAPALPAQRPMGIHVELAPDVQAANGPAAEVFRVWRSYLARWPAQRGPNLHWSREEQERLRQYDLVGSLTYGRPEFRRSHHGIVLGITPADSGASSEPPRYVIRTLFASNRGYREAVIVHVYALRAAGTWVLSNALAQRTRGWRSAVAGPITYAFPPTHAFDTARAARAVRFVDSLAAALDAGRVAPLLYVMARDSAEMRQLLGLEQYPRAFAGRASLRNRLLLSGEPDQGEAHLHELAHFVIGQVVDPASHNVFVVEGAASWAAGRVDGSLRTRINRLRRELARRPTLSLREVTGVPIARGDRAFYPLGAVLCQMAFERGGLGAVKRLLRAGPTYDDLLQTVTRALDLTSPAVDDAWRAYVLAYAPH